MTAVVSAYPLGGTKTGSAQRNSQAHGSLLEQALSSPPHWASGQIQPWNERLFQDVTPFITDKYWSSGHSINVFTVVGTQHPDYVGMTWLEFLQRGKRMRENLALHQSNRAYYLDTRAKTPPMYYVSLNGLDWYVAGDGNHRTCIARFDFHGESHSMLHGVNLEDYRVDWTLYRAYPLIQATIARGESVTPVRERVSRSDTAGWMHERYSVRLLLKTRREERLLDRIAVEAMLHKTPGLLGRILGG